MSQEKKHDSALIGWTEDPKFNDNNELMSWTLKLKDHEIKEMADKYMTAKNDKGHGGNVFLTLRMSKGGKAFCTVYDPHSEAAKESRSKRANASESSDDLPF